MPSVAEILALDQEARISETLRIASHCPEISRIDLLSPRTQREICGWHDAPPRPSGEITVSFEYLGRTGPLPSEGPYDE